MDEQNKNNPYVSPSAKLLVEDKIENRIENLKKWGAIVFLLVHSVYVFSYSIATNKIIFSVWGFLSLAVVFGIIKSREWTLTAYYFAAFQGIARSIYVAYVVVANSGEYVGQLFLLTKIISTFVWVMLWIVVGVYLRRKFKGKL